MKSKEMPYVLYVAEIIYSKIFEIKSKNSDFSTIDAFDAFMGSDTYNKISSGKFHDEWFEKLMKDKELTRSIRDLTIGLSKFLNEVYP